MSMRPRACKGRGNTMTLDIITLALSGAAALLALLCFLARQKQAATGQDIARLRDEISGELREVRTELVANVHSAIQTTAQLQAEAQKQASDAQNTRIRELTEQLAQRQAALQKTVTDQLQLVETRMKNSAVESEQKLENIRTTMETRISSMQADNAKKLDAAQWTKNCRKRWMRSCGSRSHACQNSWKACIRALARCRRLPQVWAI